MANNKAYKRSWKNYLLDPSYQLRFTLTMMVVAAGLMAPLGYWVAKKADTATKVALNQIDGVSCPDVLSAEEPVAAEDMPETAPGAQVESETLDSESVDDAQGAESEQSDQGEPQVAVDNQDDVAAGEEEDDAAADDGDRDRVIKVTIDDSEMPEPQVTVGEMAIGPSEDEIAASVKAHQACQEKLRTRRNSVTSRKDLISRVILFSGIALLLGLGIYGIKATHRVAGPLFKVGLYLKKLENGVYDEVYDLRKGDQLVDFYDHFKMAHAKMTTMRKEDCERLRQAIDMARQSGLDDDPKLAAIVEELEAKVAEMEKGLVS